MSTSTDLPLERARVLYRESSREVRDSLEELFNRRDLCPNVIDRINDFQDVLTEIGKLPGEVIPWPNPKNKSQRYMNACGMIDAITAAYNEGTALDFTNTSQPKYYLYFERTAQGWVLYAVGGNRYSASLGSGSYFKTEALARAAYAKFKEVWDDFLPE